MNSMKNDKRITLLCGHYGSGKTNVAVNLAMMMKKQYDKVTIADLDIVNPYFRTKDSSEELARAGIKLICSEFANSNVDIPALPQEMYSITDDTSHRVIIDVGGLRLSCRQIPSSSCPASSCLRLSSPYAPAPK